MSYTSIWGKQTAEHVSSDTWHNGNEELRIHRFRCKCCHGEYVQAERIYEKCPLCGFPILHYRRAV